MHWLFSPAIVLQGDIQTRVEDIQTRVGDIQTRVKDIQTRVGVI